MSFTDASLAQVPQPVNHSQDSAWGCMTSEPTFAPAKALLPNPVHGSCPWRGRYSLLNQSLGTLSIPHAPVMGAGPTSPGAHRK